MMRIIGVCVVFVLLRLLTGQPAFAAETYPSRPIRIIVPFAAGGPSDATGRMLAEVMAQRLNKPVVVENFGGAGGNVGALRAAKSAPDGYTLMFTNISMAVSPALYPHLAYDPVNDFIGIGIAMFQPTMLVARPSFGKLPLKDFIEYLKSKGEKVAAATTGPGGPSFLCASLLMKQLGTRFNLIAYQGTGPAMLDVAAGRADFVCDAAITASAQARAGNVKAYGIVGNTRSNLVPDLPTLAEQGLPNVALQVWSGLYAPKGTPPAIVGRISAALQGALRDPDFQRKMTAVGQEIPRSDLTTPAGAAAFLRAEISKWTPLIKAWTPSK